MTLFQLNYPVQSATEPMFADIRILRRGNSLVLTSTSSLDTLAPVEVHHGVVQLEVAGAVCIRERILVL